MLAIGTIVAIHTDPYTHRDAEGTARIVRVLREDAEGVYRCVVKFLSVRCGDKWEVCDDNETYERLVVLCDSPESQCSCLHQRERNMATYARFAYTFEAQIESEVLEASSADVHWLARADDMDRAVIIRDMNGKTVAHDYRNLNDWRVLARMLHEPTKREQK